MRSIWVPLLAVLLSAPGPVLPQDPSDGINWLDAAPGVAMEYKVHVDAAKEDCYYQYVHPGATFYVSYQVLKGGCIGFVPQIPRNGPVMIDRRLVVSRSVLISKKWLTCFVFIAWI